MKITDIRSMRLWGPRNHGVGGGDFRWRASAGNIARLARGEALLRVVHA